MRFARPIPPDLGKTGDADSGAAQARGRFAPSRTVMRIFAARAFPGKSRILAYRRDLNSTDFSFRKQASFGNADSVLLSRNGNDSFVETLES